MERLTRCVEYVIDGLSGSFASLASEDCGTEFQTGPIGLGQVSAYSGADSKFRCHGRLALANMVGAAAAYQLN